MIAQALIFTEAILVLLWLLVDSPHAEIIQVDEYFGKVDNLECVSTQVILPVLVFYKFSLLIASTLYAFRVRKAPSEFHEARHLSMATYNILVCCVVVIPLQFMPDLDSKVLFIFESVGVIVAVLGTQALILFPKLNALLHGTGYVYRNEDSTSEDPVPRAQQYHRNQDLNDSEMVRKKERGGERVDSMTISTTSK